MFHFFALQFLFLFLSLIFLLCFLNILLCQSKHVLFTSHWNNSHELLLIGTRIVICARILTILTTIKTINHNNNNNTYHDNILFIINNFPTTIDTINIMITTSSIEVFDYTGSSDTRSRAIINIYINHEDISKYDINKTKPPSRWQPEFDFDFDNIKFSKKYKQNIYYNVHNMVIYHYYHELDYENKNQMIYIHDTESYCTDNNYDQKHKR